MRSLAIIALAILAGPALAQGGDVWGDVEKGAELAAKHCASCHDISPGGAWKEHPPSFASIAKFRGREQIVARIYFPPYHASMPQFSELMFPNHVYDLTAYIQSLEAE